VEGILKGFDQLVNLVLDEAVEHFDNKMTRKLGTTVCRGTTVMLICPEDGYEEIANPFLAQEE
jgi:U6 snRNA-associated Sm-like protein LSm7